MPWKTLKRFPIWGTNFPLEWLSNLKFSNSYSKICNYWQSEEILIQKGSSLREQIASIEFNDSFRKTRNKLLSHLRELRSISPFFEVLKENMILPPNLLLDLTRWEEELNQHKNNLLKIKEIFMKEFEEKRRQLWEYSKNTQFKEALFQLNPDFLSQIEHYQKKESLDRRDSQMKRRENTIMSYLARLCSKSTIAGRMGPTMEGFFSSQNSKPFSFQWNKPNSKTPGIGSIKILFSHWGAQELANQIRKDPTLRLCFPLRIHPWVSLEDGKLVSYLTPSISPFCPQQTYQEISPSVRMRIEPNILESKSFFFHDFQSSSEEMEKIQSELFLLLEKRFVLDGLDIPPGHFEPLQYLMETLDQASPQNDLIQHWKNRLLEFENLRERFEKGNFDERQVILCTLEKLFLECTGKEPRRGAGQYYADRFLLFEECLRNCGPLELGSLVEQEFLLHYSLALELLAPLWLARIFHPFLVLWNEHEKKNNISHKENLPRWLANLGENVFRSIHQKMPKELLNANTEKWLKGIQNLFDLSWDILNPEDTEIREYIISDSDPKIIEYRNQFQTLMKLGNPPLPVFASGAFFQIQAPSLEKINQGDFQIVLDEIVFGGGMNLSISSLFSPTREDQLIDTEKAFREMINVEKGRLASFVPVFQQNSKFSSFIHPGMDIEFLGPSFKNHSEKLNPQNILFSSISDHPRQLSAENGQTKENLTIIPPNIIRLDRKLLVDDFEEHFPQIRIGKCILQREQWKMSSSVFEKALQNTKDPFETYMETIRIHLQKKLPVMIFVDPSGPKKTIFIDFENFFLVEVLLGMSREDEMFQISQMLPDLNNSYFDESCEKEHFILSLLPFLYYEP